MSIKRTKIFHIIISPVIGGAEKLLLTLAKGADKAKFDIILGVFTHSQNELLYKEAIKLGIAVEPIKVKHSYDISQLINLYRLIKKHRPNIIHTHGYKTNMLGFIMAKLFRIPIVTTFHGWGESSNVLTRIYYMISFKLLPYFNLIIAVSNQIRETVGTMGVPARRLRTIKNIPGLVAQEPAFAACTLKEELGIPQKAKTVGFIGRLEQIKGCRQFIQAASVVNKKEPDIRFLVIGEGQEREVLEHQVKELGLKDRVIFCGYRFDMAPVYKELDLYVISSLSEGIPLTLLEAMYYGIPIVATRVGGIPEVIRDGINGILVPPNDDKALAENIITSLTHRQKTMERALEAKKTIATEFSVKKWIRMMEGVYVDISNSATESNKI